MQFLRLFLVLSAGAVELSAQENPIRRIVNLLQGMQKKIEEEGEAQDKMFEKFVCYCQINTEKLQKSTDDLTESIPQHEASVKSKVEMKAQIEEELKGHKTDREEATSTVGTATEQRDKDKKAFDAYAAEAKANIASVTKAVEALRKGLGDSFLQSGAAVTLKRVLLNTNTLSSFDQEEVEDFLQGKASSSGTGEIVGILEQMGEEMAADLKEATESEAASLVDFDGLVAAKNKEIQAATTAIEDKTARVGTLAVDIVNAKNDLSDAQDALTEDSGFLVELKTSCAEQVKLYDMVKKMRAEEITAVGATIKILNDDDALDLFKKTLPSPGESLLQVHAHSSSRARAQYLLQQAQASASATTNVDLRLVQLALKGKKVGFEKIVTMMDNMVTLLGKEQKEDEEQKEYCEAEFEKSDDEEKELDRKIKGLDTEIGEGKEAIAALKDGIATLLTGIADLDKSVAEATETRKEEAAEYTTTKSQNSAAVQLLEVAKNQLNKFYNPTLYKAPPAQEMTEEERIYAASGGTVTTAAPGGIAGTGVTAFLDQLSFVQVKAKLDGPPPPPPMAVEAYKKQDSGGPVALIDRLKNDLKMEMQEDDMEEKQAQKDYEETMAQSAKKRATDSKTIVEKEQQMAEAEAILQKATEAHKSESEELMALKEYIANLHKECDFLLENFDARKTARTNEIEAIKKAKAVLAGADFSLAQASFVQVQEAKRSEPVRRTGFLEKQEAQCTAESDEQHRLSMLQSLKKLYKQTNDACVEMCKKMGQYPKCQCADFEPPDSTPGVVTWDELYGMFDELKDSGRTMLKKYSEIVHR
jgi:peptidoglycan hydrolase CwlO-like protein